jgi:tetratricopeptide (TPR) repeat protein
MNDSDRISESTIPWLQTGCELFKQEKYDEALKAFERAIAEDSQNAKAWNYRGNCLSALQCPAAALGAYDRAVALEPGYHQAWFNRGLLLMEMGAYGNAIAAFDRAIALDPDPCYLHAKCEIWLKKKLVAV